MDPDAPLIYGLEFQARTLTAQIADNEVVRFFIGTQSLRCDNQVHQLEFDEEIGSLNKTVYLHRDGEIWHMAASPVDADRLSTCYSITQNGKCDMACAIWRLPNALSTSHLDESSSLSTDLELICKLDHRAYGHDIKCCVWKPNDGDDLLTVVDNRFIIWDQSSSDIKVKSTAVIEGKSQPRQAVTAKWNPHQSSSSVAVACDSSVKSFDLRSMKQCWVIDGAHTQIVRDLDFNPNRQYYMATCGDDCKVKFWDVRHTASPVLVFDHHSHWVWSVRYNHFHDQLVLSASSDSRVVLSCAATISSESFGQAAEDETDLERGHQRPVPRDGVLATYDEHEDSVYAAEWASADPWTFASLSYNGRVVIAKVPRAEKFNILL